jgi:ubiquinone/menaquinone biosynthesis C-methylase UbiE
MVDHQHWQLDGNAPELFQRYLVPAITAKWAEDIVDRARPQAGEQILDIACGTGVVARLASRRISLGHVTGLDVNKGMLAVARTLPREGAPIDWIEASALDLPFPAGQFDLVLCQQGLQFIPDKGRALREIRRVLSPSGRVALSVYSPIERTPGANAFVSALDRVLGPTASKIKRAEHSFNAPDELKEPLMDAGFAEVGIQTVVLKIAFPSVLDYVRFQLLATPMSELLSDLSETDRQTAIKTIASETASFSNPEMLEGGGFSFGQEAYVGTARAAG